MARTKIVEAGDLITYAKAAEILGCDKRTVRGMAERGALVAHLCPLSNAPRLSRAQVEAILPAVRVAQGSDGRWARNQATDGRNQATDGRNQATDGRNQATDGRR